MGTTPGAERGQTPGPQAGRIQRQGDGLNAEQPVDAAPIRGPLHP